MDANQSQETGQHLLRELGLTVTRAGDELHGSAEVVPEMFVPGTTSVRTSILATWADTVTGLLAVDVMPPRIPTTLELEVQLYQRPQQCRTIQAVGRVVKAGRSVVVLSVDFTMDAGEPLALGSCSFMATPDQTLTFPEDAVDLATRPMPQRLRVPLAERAGCERREPGVAVLPRSEDGLNSAKTLNGGLIALVAEEAALSLTPGATLSSMALRYLRPVRIGPAVATARVHAGLGRVEVCDAGNDDRLAVVATTRTFH